MHRIVAAATAAVLFGWADAAHAYIDPNTSSYVFRTIAPFFLAILGVLAVFYRSVNSAVRRAIDVLRQRLSRSRGGRR